MVTFVSCFVFSSVKGLELDLDQDLKEETKTANPWSKSQGYQQETR